MAFKIDLVMISALRPVAGGCAGTSVTQQQTKERKFVSVLNLNYRIWR